MSRKNYAELEQHIINMMRYRSMFDYQNQMYKVLNVGKPRPFGRGECKTDVYAAIQHINSGTVYELKISVKKEGFHEFEGNKVTAEMAEATFGQDWQEIVYTATSSLRYEFESRLLLYASPYRKIKPNSITVGWKLEFARRPRELSVRLPLEDQQVRDFIYKGTNQPENKINARVNGNIIAGSGIAEYLLETTVSKMKTPADVLAQIVRIDYVDINDTYMVFTANNYRTDICRADGTRSLAVRIEWQVKGQKLYPVFCYDSPLEYTGEKDMAPLVRNALRQLGIRNISEINPYTDLLDPNIYRA